MTIYIENKKKYKGIGVYIGRPSILGNPFTHLNRESTLAKYQCLTRDESIIKYEEYFYIMLEKDSEFKREVERLVLIAEERDLHLVCWCTPKSCHGNIIKKYIEKRIKDNA